MESSDLFMPWVKDDVDEEAGSGVTRRASEPRNLPRRVIASAAWCLLKASINRPSLKLALFHGKKLHDSTHR